VRIISKYISFALFGIFIISYSGKAQNQEADSLKRLLDMPLEKAEKIKALNALSLSLNNYKPDTSIVLATEALKLAQEANSADAARKSKHAAGRAYYQMGNYDTSFNIYDNLRLESITAGDSMMLATSLYEIGRINRANGENDTALDTLKKALNIRRSIKDTAGIAEALNLTANIYSDIGNYSAALEMYHEATMMDQAINDLIGLSDRYNNMARIHLFRKDYKKAMEYFTKSYQITLDLDDLFGQRILTNNMAFVLRQQNRYEEALDYLFTSLKIYEEINEVCGDMYPTFNIGSIYQETGRLDSAEVYLLRALERSQECNDQYLVSLTYIDLGKLYLKTNELQKSESYLIKAFENAKTRGLTAEAKDASKVLSTVYDELGKANLSLKYYKIFHELYDSLYNEENTRRLARLEAEFEFQQQKQKEELNRRLTELEKEKQLANAIWVRNTLIVAFIVLSIFLLLTYRNYIRKNRANNQLNELNRKISNQKDTLAEQAEELKSANEEIRIINENLEKIVKDRTRVITNQNKKILEYVFYNSHQVRGPLARILGLVALFEKKGIKTEEMQEKLTEIKKEAQDLDFMVKKMNRTLEEGKKSLENES